jgi:hypothetical protein
MAGYLDQYGVADARRESRVKKIVLATLAVVILGTVGYFTFRTWPQERVLKAFLEKLTQKDFQGAYRMWGCTPENPCKSYDPGRFAEDWGPESPNRNAAGARIENIDFCDSGVVFNVSFPGAMPVNLWVERSTNIISFAPWERCPGRHLQIRQFLKRIFS